MCSTRTLDRASNNAITSTGPLHCLPRALFLLPRFTHLFISRRLMTGLYIDALSGHDQEHEEIAESIFRLDKRIKLATVIASASIGMNLALMTVLLEWVK